MFVRKKIPPTEKAQSLVEMAVVTPILVLMLIGLFEVGYALWGYMTLLNVDREATRFAIREGALDFSDNDALDYGTIGYSNSITHALVSNANQLQLADYLNNTGADDPKATVIITHLVIDTQKPCDAQDDDNNSNNDQCYADDPPDCSDATLASNAYTSDDLVLHPEMSGYEYLRYTVPQNNPAYQSRLIGTALDDKVAELRLANDRFNCQLKSKGFTGAWSNNSSIVVEMFYEQPQLLNFPLLSWIANPIPMYVQTTMRIDSKDSGKCEVYPIALHKDNVDIWLEGGSDEHDVFNGGDSDDKGWLSWNVDDTDAEYLEAEMINPRLSGTDFKDPTNTSDTVLNAGNWVAGLRGTNNSSEITAQLRALAGKTIMVPVWDDFDTNRYHIAQFALIQIVSYTEQELTNNLAHDIIYARLVQKDVTWACP